ncbi:MAG: hypothetical protein ACI4PW_07945 [Alphaproteobacteria bacterium]|jgi:hypothetical protein
MDTASRQNLKQLFAQMETKPISVFTDLDKTSCLEGNVAYATGNAGETGVPGCFMQPDIRRAFAALKENGGSVYIVTGRHWADTRVNDVTGEHMPDGAFHDLLGGAPEFRAANAVAGHGRLVVKEGKTSVLRRDASPENTFREQKFERYVGERVLGLKQDIFRRCPEARGQIRAEYKKHLSYINIDSFRKTRPAEGKALFDFIDEQMHFIMDGRNPDGSRNPDAPENPDNALFYTVEPTGSMEIRSRNQSKRNGVEKSGFLEEVFERGGPVLVMGDSLGKNGTDRDMVEAVRGFFEKKNAADRVFVVHVMNGENNRLTDKSDPCHPDISVKDPDELGQMMKIIAGQSRNKNRDAAVRNVLLNRKQRSL